MFIPLICILRHYYKTAFCGNPESHTRDQKHTCIWIKQKPRLVTCTCLAILSWIWNASLGEYDFVLVMSTRGSNWVESNHCKFKEMLSQVTETSKSPIVKLLRLLSQVKSWSRSSQAKVQSKNLFSYSQVKSQLN